MSEPAAAPAKPVRKRPPPRLTRVRSVERITPRVIRVTVEGEELEGFGPPKPGGHIKLFFPSGTWLPRKTSNNSTLSRLAGLIWRTTADTSSCVQLSATSMATSRRELGKAGRGLKV